MNDPVFARVLTHISTIFNFESNQGNKREELKNHRWFFSFGSLLYFIRDKNMGIPLWGDLDVSILDTVIDVNTFSRQASEFGFVLKNKIVDSRNGLPFQMVFKYQPNDLHGAKEYEKVPNLDVFFWRKTDKYYVHAYDYYMENPKSGVPSKYVFKGTPIWAMKGEPDKLPWDETAPDVNFPQKYGTLLDIWYPGWIVPDRNFGQSKATKTWKLKNCNNLEEKLK